MLGFGTIAALILFSACGLLLYLILDTKKEIGRLTERDEENSKVIDDIQKAHDSANNVDYLERVRDKYTRRD